MPRPRFTKLAPEKRDAILDSATAAFAESGLEGASYNDIIANAGVSKGAMYYYFDDKEDLYLTVLEREMAPLMGSLSELPELENADEFWAAVEGWSGSFTDLLDHSETALAILRDFVRVAAKPGASPRLSAAYAQLVSLVDTMIERGRAVGAIRDDMPLSLLRSLLMGVGEALDLWFLEHWDELEANERERLLALAMRTFRLVASG